MATQAVVPNVRPTNVHASISATRQPTAWRAAKVLSAVLIVLMAGASLAGLLVSGLYRDSASVVAMFHGYDLITLVVVAPVLLVSALWASPRSMRGQLVWVSMLGYTVYIYAFYVFGADFSAAFLLHVAIFSTALFAFVLSLAGLDPNGIKQHFGSGTPAKWIGAILVALAAVLGAMWMYFAIQTMSTGQVPTDGVYMVQPARMAQLGWVLDLALLVPSYALAGVLLWRRAAWGFVLASVVFIAGFVQQVMYEAALLFQTAEKVPGALGFDPIDPIIALAFLAGAGLLLFNAGRGAPDTTNQTLTAKYYLSENQ